jgi:hypothetical protein
MSDQFGQQPPSPYSQPTPGGMAPPPPPPPPGMFPQPGAPQHGFPPPGAPQPGMPSRGARPPSPKKRTGLIVGAIVAALALCGIGACVLGIGVLSSGTADKSAINLAEQHFNSAMNDVQGASTSLEKLSNAPSPDVTTAIASATRQLRDGRDEIAKATASAEQLKDSAGRTDYLNSLKAATATFDALQDMVAYLDTANGMATKAKQAGDLARAANKSLNAAVDSGNSRKYTAMRAQAVSASTNYTKAAVIFREAQALDVTAGFDKAAAYADKRKAQADIVVRMAEEGKAGRLSAYNADIKKQAALSKQAEAVGMPAIVSDPNWAQNRLADLSKRIDAAAGQADSLRAKALKELGVTK